MISKTNILLTLLFFSYYGVRSQYWKEVGDGLSGGGGDVRDFEIDSTNHLLYAVGAFEIAGGDTVNHIAVYDGFSWSNIGDLTGFSPGGRSISIEKFQNKLFVGGQFEYSDSIWLYESSIQWDGTNWISCGDPNSDVVFEVANNTLFALGHFDTISNQAIKKIARWNGVNWEPFGGPTPFYNVSNGLVCRTTFYKGSYYFGGNFSFASDWNEIIRWDGDSWETLDNGILGGLADVMDMVVYKGLLFVCGYFKKPDGNVGDYIMTWDGDSWGEPFPNVNFNSQIKDLEIIDNILYFSGGEHLVAGQLIRHNLAKYDGQTFCSFGNGMPNGIGILSSFNDTLLVASSLFINPIFGDSIYNLAQWIGGNSTDTCISQPIANMKPKPAPEPLTISPNPNNGNFEITFTTQQSGECTIEIFSSLGVLVKEIQVVVVSGENKIALIMEDYSKGMYFVRANVNATLYGAKILVE